MTSQSFYVYQDAGFDDRFDAARFEARRFDDRWTVRA